MEYEAASVGVEIRCVGVTVLIISVPSKGKVAVVLAVRSDVGALPDSFVEVTAEVTPIAQDGTYVSKKAMVMIVIRRLITRYKFFIVLLF